jgi:hypothetical protein
MLPANTGGEMRKLQRGRLAHVDCNVDVAARGFGIQTGLVRGVDQGLGDFVRQTGQADVEASLEKEVAFSEITVGLYIG